MPVPTVRTRKSAIHPLLLSLAGLGVSVRRRRRRMPAVGDGRVGVVPFLRIADLLGDGELDAAALAVGGAVGAFGQLDGLLHQDGDGRAEHHLLLPADGLRGGDDLLAAVLSDLGHVDADRHVNLLQVRHLVAVLDCGMLKNVKEKLDKDDW